MFATVQLQIGELEVAFVAAWVGAHEGPLLAALRPDDGRSDAGHPPHVLAEATKISIATHDRASLNATVIYQFKKKKKSLNPFFRP